MGTEQVLVYWLFTLVAMWLQLNPPAQHQRSMVVYTAYH